MEQERYKNKCLHRFGRKDEKYCHFVHLELDERIIFKRILKKCGGREMNSADSEDKQMAESEE
jgi:hypothetical protein